jgi:ribosomal protein S18 acetylase RimI-like enzyme
LDLVWVLDPRVKPEDDIACHCRVGGNPFLLLISHFKISLESAFINFGLDYTLKDTDNKAMSIRIVEIKDNLTLLDPILDDMETAWRELGQSNPFRTEMVKKFPQVELGSIRGIILLENDSPVGLVWLEMPDSEHYGSLLVHSCKAELRQALMAAFVDKNWTNGAVFELIQLEHTFDYRDALIALGLYEKERQRMKREIPPDFPIQNARNGISFHPLNDEPACVVGELSASAHSLRQKIEGYFDFGSAENRANMESKLRTNEFGKLVPTACTLMRFNGEVAGTITVIEISAWGYERIAWIMDVAVAPQYQGFGYGGDLVKRAMYGAKRAGIHDIGLGVTVSNEGALKLYEKLGFVAFEYFVEFLDYRTPLL